MINWLRDNEDAAALFCGMGMGKTVVTLEHLDWLFTTGRSKGALVISPLRTTTLTWPRQVASWAHSSWMKVADMRTPEGAAAWEAGSAMVYLINYEQLATREVTVKCRPCKGHGCDECKNSGFKVRKDYGFVHKFIRKRKELPVDTLVWDELSMAKNPASKRINAVRAHREMFDRHYGLTGTPCCNDYRDLFAQVRLLDGGERFGTVFSHYLNKYFEKADFMGFKYKLRPGAKDEIDAKIATLALVMLSEDHLDLPTCTAEDVMVELPAKARKAYKELETELLAQLDTGEIEAVSAAALVMKLAQISAGCAYDKEKDTHVIHDAKIEALRKIQRKHKGEPLLVATMFRHERERILKAFPEAEMFDENKMDKWKAGKIPMWVTDYRSIAFGVDGLQHGGRIAVWMSQTYSMEGYTQFNARLVRVGQAHETRIIRVLAKDTVDEAIVEAQRVKSDEQGGLFTALKNLQILNKTSL